MIHLYSDPRCALSHILRLILIEKSMDYQLIDISANSEELTIINQYNSTPVLIDDIDKNNKKKDLILIDTNIMAEYIEERFPHPQLMPIEPIDKARIRTMLHRIEQEIFIHIRCLDKTILLKDAKNKRKNDALRQAITVFLEQIAGIFNNNRTEFFASNSFSLLDTAILPILWRLKYYGIVLLPTWNAMLKYASHHFNRKSFQGSLSAPERSMISI